MLSPLSFPWLGAPTELLREDEDEAIESNTNFYFKFQNSMNNFWYYKSVQQLVFSPELDNEYFGQGMGDQSEQNIQCKFWVAMLPHDIPMA
jgi:hypothetical protein